MGGPAAPGPPLRVILHIGTPKTGTTHLQEVLWNHREELAAQDVHYLGDSFEDHFRAALDLAGGEFNDLPVEVARGAWPRLVEQARSHTTGTVVISHELFGDVPEQAARRAVQDLSFADLRVVVTARDLGRQIPAAWQEDVKNWHRMTFTSFLDEVRPGPQRDEVREWWGDNFWVRQDVPAVLARWSGALAADHLVVITVPPSGADRSLLWERFASLFHTDVGVLGGDIEYPNTSLGRVGVELLRQLNLVLNERVPWPAYGDLITHELAPRHIAEIPDDEPVRLPDAEQTWVAHAARDQVEALRRSGATVVGDLAELVPRARPGARAPDDVSDDELARAALEVLAGVMMDLHTGTGVVWRLPQRPPEPEAEPPAEDAGRGRAADLGGRAAAGSRVVGARVAGVLRGALRPRRGHVPS